jgi:hypothetical protein
VARTPPLDLSRKARGFYRCDAERESVILILRDSQESRPRGRLLADQRARAISCQGRTGAFTMRSTALR